MISATVWVRGPHDDDWRINAVFHRSNVHDAASRAGEEQRWYERRGYQTHVGPEAPEAVDDDDGYDGDGVLEYPEGSGG